jgi:hypothetical protein
MTYRRKPEPTNVAYLCSISSTEKNLKIPLTVFRVVLFRVEINKKTDLRIKLSSIERSKHRPVVALTFAIKTQAISNPRL